MNYICSERKLNKACASSDCPCVPDVYVCSGDNKCECAVAEA